MYALACCWDVKQLTNIILIMIMMAVVMVIIVAELTNVNKVMMMMMIMMIMMMMMEMIVVTVCSNVVVAMDGSESVRRWEPVMRDYLAYLAMRYVNVNNAIGVVVFGTDVNTQSDSTMLRPETGMSASSSSSELVVRGFLRVLRFPPFLHRLMVSANKIKLE